MSSLDHCSTRKKSRKNTVTKQLTTNHKLFIGDSLKILADKKYIKNKSIDLIVTSPPYGLSKNYGEYSDKFNIESWTNMIKLFGQKSKRILKDNGSIFLNISPIPEPINKEIFPLDSYAYFALKECGFYLRNKIIWHFNNMQNCSRRLSGRWESILWFVKDIQNYNFNLEEIRIPYITKKDKRLTGTGRNPTDVWYFDRVNNMTKTKYSLYHPTVYPDPMIERIIKMSTNELDLILDPFVGSGTTMKVAKNMRRNSIGIEIDQKYEKLVKNRMKEERSNDNFSLQVTHYDNKK